MANRSPAPRIPGKKAYPDYLPDALMKALGSGASSLEELVAALNRQGLMGPAGVMWTADLLGGELRALAGPETTNGHEGQE